MRIKPQHKQKMEENCLEGVPHSVAFAPSLTPAAACVAPPVVCSENAQHAVATAASQAATLTGSSQLASVKPTSKWVKYLRQESQQAEYWTKFSHTEPGVKRLGFEVSLLSLQYVLNKGTWWWTRRKLLQMVPKGINFNFGDDAPPQDTHAIHLCAQNLEQLLWYPKLTHAHMVLLSEAQFDEICDRLA